MIHWFVLYERILLVMMTSYTGLYFMRIVNGDDLVHWFVLYEPNIVNEDDFVHWFVLYERILLMRMTWHAGFYFMNKYCYTLVYFMSENC